MLATRQPPNLRKMLTKAKFDLIPEIKYQPPPGLYPCQNCTYCRRGYIKNMDSFSVVGENGYVSTWKFTHHFSCDSENVLYVCKILVDENFYLGRTVNVKNRTAKHISDVLNPANSKCKEFTEYARNSSNLVEPFFLFIPFYYVQDENLRDFMEKRFIRRFGPTLNGYNTV